MNNAKSKDWTARKSTIVRHMAYWSGSYVITMALATFGPEFLWDYNQPLTIGGILLNLIAGIGMIVSNIRYLDVLDEMMKKIQLEAMGLSLGVAIVAGLSYSLLDITNIIPFDAEISFLVMLIGVVYLASLAINLRRYR